MPACEEYHLPKDLRRHIDYITPGVKLLAPVQSLREKRDAILAKNGIEKRINHSLLKTEGRGPYSFSNGTNSTNALSTCDVTITPACVAALYQIPPTSLTPNPNNSLGIFESELQFYTQADLDDFFTNFTSGAIPNGTHPVAANVDGGQQSTEDPYYAGGEVSLDLQLAYPIVYPQTITDYEVDDFIVQANQLDTYTFGFNTFLDALDGVS